MKDSTGSNILILTRVGDFHAYAVSEVLRQKGAAAEIWHTTDFPTKMMETVIFEDGRMKTGIRGPGMRFENPEITTVWNRRPGMVLDKEIFHEADRPFAESESKLFRASIFEAFCESTISRGSFWINNWNASQRAERKIFQHHIAGRLGFETPDTIYTNDPEAIRSFIEKHGGRAAYKAFYRRPWTDGENMWMLFTSIVGEEDLPDDEMLQNTPGIYQEIIPKDYELRLTVMGNRIFGAKLLSQEMPEGSMDWRRAHKEIEMIPYEVEPALAELCLRFMKEMGLVFGCLDFVITPEGHPVFLEINQMGQFLFLETQAGLPMLDAFSEFLIQGRVDFEWDIDKAKILLDEEMLEKVDTITKDMEKRHVADPPVFWAE